MKLINNLYDNRIQAYNLLFEISIEEYLSMSLSIIESNELQRKRVKSSSTIYSLLKKDLLVGCIIPPIVLALSSDNNPEFSDNSEEDEYVKHIKDNQKKLIILDGLQRTLTIRDLQRDLQDEKNLTGLEQLNKQKLRVEVYVGINKVGILYRMLTLNTGQTPMSMRHQIEILYSDYLGMDLDVLTLLLESDNKSISKSNEYNFRDVVEGFNSYLDRNYLPMDRNNILENIESLEKLSSETQQGDLFLSYLKSFDGLIKTLTLKAGDWVFNPENLDNPISGSPFGDDPEKLFKKPQVMTGFGSAVGKLINDGVIKDFDELQSLYERLDLGVVDESFNNYIVSLDKIKIMAKKIGTDQRMFFNHFFREIFDSRNDSYLKFNDSVKEAYSIYLRKTE